MKLRLPKLRTPKPKVRRFRIKKLGTGGKNGTTVATAAAMATSQAAHLEDPDDDDRKSRQAKPWFFQKFIRPAVNRVNSGSEYTLEVAKKENAKAIAFMEHKASLTPHEDTFYEDVELEHVSQAFTAEEDEEAFVDTLQRMRKTSNTNARRLCLYLGIGVTLAFSLFVVLVGAFPLPVPWLTLDSISLGDVSFSIGQSSFAAILGLTGGVFVMWFTSTVLYNQMQEKNAVRFSGFVEAFLDRLRSSLDEVIRKLLIIQDDELHLGINAVESHASTWTISQYWLIKKLHLAEYALRNIFFQIKRNTVLYRFGGALLSGMIVLATPAVLWLTSEASWVDLTVVTVTGLLLVHILYKVLLEKPYRVVISNLVMDDWGLPCQLNLKEKITIVTEHDKSKLVQWQTRYHGGNNNRLNDDFGD